MHFEIRPATEIDDALALEWTQLLRAQGFDNLPFLKPEYIKAMAPYRSSLRVATASENGRVCAVLAFEQQGSTGHPPGILLSDYQALIGDPGIADNTAQLLRHWGLRRLEFDHLITENSPFTRWHDQVEESYWIDLSGGIENWESPKDGNSRQALKNAARKQRKLIRECGQPEFEWHTEDDDVFAQILEWKSRQRVRTQTFDILQLAWVREFLQELRLRNEPGLQACLSTARVNGRLISGSFGLLTERSYYDWIPAYDTDFSRFSPGLLLAVWKIREAARRGLQRFDFGKGAHQQKLSLSNARTFVAEAVVDSRPLHHLGHLFSIQSVRLLKSTGLIKFAQLPKRLVRSWTLRNSMK